MFERVFIIIILIEIKSRKQRQLFLISTYLIGSEIGPGMIERFDRHKLKYGIKGKNVDAKVIYNSQSQMIINNEYLKKSKKN